MNIPKQVLQNAASESDSFRTFLIDFFIEKSETKNPSSFIIEAIQAAKVIDGQKIQAIKNLREFSVGKVNLFKENFAGEYSLHSVGSLGLADAKKFVEKYGENLK